MPSSVLQTERLRLEPIAWEHLRPLARLRADPGIMFTMRDGPETPARTRATLKTYLLTWRARGFGVWAICDRDSGRFLGECGFWQRQDSLGAALRFAVVPEAQGRGLAREAALASLAFGFEAAGLRRVIAVAQDRNVASHRILQSLGMTRLRWRRVPIGGLTYYCLRREDWKRAQAAGA